MTYIPSKDIFCELNAMIANQLITKQKAIDIISRSSSDKEVNTAISIILMEA